MKTLQASDYLDHVRRLLKKGMNKQALALLEEAVNAFPNNPFLLSYYGALLAVVAKDFARGIRTSELALKLLAAAIPMNIEAHYPVFYLNIGRAYLAAGDRKKAVLAFRKGLKYDSLNPDILEETDKLGVRRKPPLPGLRRSHPLNKYIGLILHKLGK